MISLLEATVDTVIEDDSQELLDIQRLTSYDDKQRERQALQEFLDKHETALRKVVEPLVHLQDHTRTLQVYFMNLQALAHTDAPARAALAVEELSNSIKNANNAMSKKDEFKITDDQKQALGQLARTVTRGIKAAQLNRALKRDAPIIGEQLILHEKVLRQISGILTQSSEEKRVVLKKNEVVQPYLNKNISNQEKWIEARKRVLKGTFVDEGLERATEASQKMQLEWQGLIEGKEDLGSIQLLLDDINEIAVLTQRLRKAAESKGGSDGR